MRFPPVALIVNLWNRSPFSFSKKRAHCCTDTQEEMRYEGSPVIVVESLPRSENFEVSLRYVLKHATCRCGNIFQLFDTSEKPNHFVASRRRWLESQGRDDARQENGRNEWYDLGHYGAKAKAPPCSDSTLQTPLPQQSSSSAREEGTSLGSD